MVDRRQTKVGELVRLRLERFPTTAATVPTTEKKAAVFDVLHFDPARQLAFISFPSAWGGGKQDHLGVQKTGIYISTEESALNLIPAVELFSIGSKVQLSDLYFSDKKNLILAADPQEEFEVLGYYNDYNEPSKAGQYIIGVPHSRGGNRDHKAAPVYGIRLEEKYLQASVRVNKKKSAQVSKTEEQSEKIQELKQEIEGLRSEVQNLIQTVETSSKTEQSSIQDTTETEPVPLTSHPQEPRKETIMSNSPISDSEKWASRVQEAGVRTGVKKFQELTRKAIGSYLRKYLEEDKSVHRTKNQINHMVSGLESFLGTPFGEMTFCLIIGTALEKGRAIGIEKGMLPDDPTSKLNFYLEKIEEELLISGTATGMEAVIDFAMGMFPGVQDMIGSLPDVPTPKKEAQVPQAQVQQQQEVITLKNEMRA